MQEEISLKKEEKVIFQFRERGHELPAHIALSCRVQPIKDIWVSFCRAGILAVFSK